MPILVNERDIEPKVKKKANQFFSFKFGDIQLLDNMNLLGGATSVDSFLKGDKTKETNGFFPYEWFDCPEKMNNKGLPHITPFLAFCAISTPLERVTTTFNTLLTVIQQQSSQ